MVALALLLAAAECLVPDGPAVARARLADGRAVVARAGALEVGGRRITFCDGLPDPQPTALAVVGARVAVGFRSAGVAWWDGARFAPVAGLPKDAVRALAAAGDVLWVGTGASGLWRVDAAGARRVSHAVLAKREITALLAARDGTIHVGAGPYGWWRIAPGGQTRLVRGVYAGCFVETRRGVEPRAPGPACAPPASAPAIATGLPSGHVTALATLGADLYVGTFDRGLTRRDAAGAFHAVAGLPPFINALAADGDALYVGTPKGLFRVHADRAERVELGLPAEHVNGLFAGRAGTLWIATGLGVVALSPAGTRLLDERAGLPSRIVYAVAETDDGAVWAGTAGGAVRFSASGVRSFTRASGALPHDWVTALLPDGSGVLAGTYDAGVARLTPDGRGTIARNLPRAWINPNGLARVDGTLYAMTLGDGLLGDGPALRLPSDDVTAVASLAGQLWVGTRAGLVRFARPIATR